MIDRMARYLLLVVAVLGIAFSAAGLLFKLGSLVTLAYADRPEILKIDVCHLDGRSGNYSLVNVNINSTDDADGVNGHGDHEGDSWAPFTYGGTDYPGQGEFPGPCGDIEPTVEPTQEPTQEPTAEPTTEPTEEPTQEPTPTPTNDPDCEELQNCETEEPTPPGETPTSEPSPTPEELPKTGDGENTEAWLCWGSNVWCSHNGVPGSEGEEWVFLYPGAAVNFRGAQYQVESMERVTPDMVSSLEDAADYDIVLITCSNYIGGVWVNRVIIFAELND